MKIRLYNALILTMDSDFDIIEGEIWVIDSTISYVGKSKSQDEVLKEQFDRAVDCKGNLLMPGFKNAHTHSGMTIMRTYCDGLPLQEWYMDKVFPLEGRLNGDDCALLTKLAILEYLTSGITAIYDMYLTPPTIAKACMESGMRAIVSDGLNNYGPKLEVEEERFLTINGKSPLVSYMINLHAEYTTDYELMEKFTKLAHKYELPIYMHNSETKREVLECIERYGKTPTAVFEDLNMFKYGGGGFHCVHMSDEDIAIFKKHDLSVVTNPASNLKLASGVAPIQRFLDENINVAIGTDGPSSNNALDMFREMYLTTALAKVREDDASAVPALSVLKMATLGGAKAMGLKDCDVLKEGKQADIILIDLNQPNMQPVIDIPRNIVYSGCKQNVKMTMIAGKILYEDGEFFIDMSAEDIYKEAAKIRDRVCEL